MRFLRPAVVTTRAAHPVWSRSAQPESYHQTTWTATVNPNGPPSGLTGRRAVDPFSADEVERARRYHAPLYVTAVADLCLSLALFGLLAFGWPGRRLADGFDGLAWWAATLAWTGSVLGLSFVLRLPVSYWRGFVREHRWGFSTQRLGGWVADRAKALGIGLVLGGGTALGFVGLARALPTTWPLAAAAAGACLVVLLSFLGPVVFEPVFNRFAPLTDDRLSLDLRALADRAGVAVRDVLVADASRRTTKENAYVSGLGRTRRVVVFDTLLSRADPAEVRLVVAHELGHRRLRHVAIATALGVAASLAAVLALWLVTLDHSLLRAAAARSAGDPRALPLLVLGVAMLQALAAPFETALSRRWESAADRFSLDLTGDVETFVRAHRSLAVSNLADLDPPRWVYLTMFTHPTPPERIAAARRWRALTGSAGPTTTG